MENKEIINRERRRILTLINKDIEYQKTLLKEYSGKDKIKSFEIFEHNKPIKWRITGMELIKKQIGEVSL